MKVNYLKYIFIAIVVVLIGLAVYHFYDDEKNKEQNVNVTSEQEIKPNILKELRLTVVGYDTMNPILSNNKNIQDLSRLIFDSLLTYDENYHLQPSLATEWSKTGDTSYILKLRRDVKWQDGSNFTASDVKFTIDRLKETPSIYAYNVQHVIGVEIIDSYTIKIVVDAPMEFFEYNLTFPILSNNFYLDQDFVTTAKNSIPMGTGMYKVHSNENGKIVLKKNQKWWQISENEPTLETITITQYSSMGEVYNAFKLGNVDLFSTQTLNLEEYIGTIGFNKKEYKGREQDFIAMNCANQLLKKAEVRKAISYAIDKNNIVANIYNGNYYTCEFPLDYDNWFYQSESNSSGYNPEQAKQVLIDAGWEYKNNVWQKTENYRTIHLSLDLVVDKDSWNRLAVAESIKENLQAVGINLNLVKVSNSQYRNYLDSKNYEMILTGNNLPLSPNLTTYFGTNNLSNYQNEELSKLLNDIQNIAEDDSFKENIKKIVEIYKTEVPMLSLYLNKNTVVYSQNLVGDITPNNYNIFYNIEKWYRQY